MKEYSVEVFKMGLFSGTIDRTGLEATINLKACEGWRFVREINEHKRVLLLFSRSVYFLIFERDTEADTPETILLRQLLTAYGHEPMA